MFFQFGRSVYFILRKGAEKEIPLLKEKAFLRYCSLFNIHLNPYVVVLATLIWHVVTTLDLKVAVEKEWN